MGRKTTMIFEDGTVSRAATITPARGVGKARYITFFLDISAVLGTTKFLDITIEEYDPLSDTWYVIDTFPQKIAIGAERRVIPTDVNSERLRANCVITGTVGPEFTFTLFAAGSE